MSGGFTTSWRLPVPHGFSRYAVFLSVVVLSALSPAVPHSITPDVAWWLAGWAFLVLMTLAGYLATRLAPGNWLTVLAPLLLYPAIWCLRCADGNSASGFTPLVVLPVLWFALYGRMREVAVAIVGAGLTTFLPVLLIGTPEFPGSSWRGYVLLLIVIAAVGPVVCQLVATTRTANNALSRSEAEFRAAFEDAPVGMAITLLTDNPTAPHFVRVNRALCALFGRTADELTRMSIMELTHPDDHQQTRERFAIATDPNAPRSVEKRYLHRTGRVIKAAVTYSVVRDETGTPTHLVCQIEDLSARHESDRVLLEAVETDLAANERLHRLERVRAEMASTVSHELRTPLTSAAGYVELLVEGDAGPLTIEQRSMLDTVSRSLTRLNGIVDDVLSMASEDGHHPSSSESVADLGDTLRGALDTLSLQAAAHGQDIVVHNDLDGAIVGADGGRIERVLVNLLSNAVKFTADDGVITVTGDRDDHSARIAVRDTGIGIAADDQQRIFERFYRSDKGGADETSGTGLGLAIVKAIISQYGGSIAVQSELGTGSTFTVTLPLRQS